MSHVVPFGTITLILSLRGANVTLNTQQAFSLRSVHFLTFYHVLSLTYSALLSISDALKVRVLRQNSSTMTTFQIIVEYN